MRRTLVTIGAWVFLAIIGVGCAPHAHGEGLDWPSNQVLPHFSRPAAVLDCVDLSHASASEYDLFVSLQGLVNRQQPRLVCVINDGEGEFTWVDVHKLAHQPINGYDAVLKYRTNVTGLVVPDPGQPDTLNLATTIGGVKNELICDPDLLTRLTNAPYNIPIIDDLRGQFKDKYEVYGWLYSNYWPRCTHRVFAGMGPGIHGSLRDYLAALKAATFWLDPGEPRDARLLRLFASGLKAGSCVCMGWWPSEQNGLEWLAQHGLAGVASDFFRNATVFSGVPATIHVPAIPPPPPLENKIYVALILSDGDNVQYMQHVMKMDWDGPARGAIPIGWTASPLAVDLDPAMLDYYWTSATTNDCLICGPSGAGYAHLNHWKSHDLAGYTHVSSSYLQCSGLRVITVWDWVNRSVARSFAKNCPNLLGLTDESGNYNHVNLGLRTIGLSPAYVSKPKEMTEWITNAAADWDGQSPFFIAAQSCVWLLGPPGLVEVARSLDTNKFILVRPDQLFLLANQARAR